MYSGFGDSVAASIISAALSRQSYFREGNDLVAALRASILSFMEKPCLLSLSSLSIAASCSSNLVLASPSTISASMALNLFRLTWRGTRDWIPASAGMTELAHLELDKAFLGGISSREMLKQGESPGAGSSEHDHRILHA